jgi:hypothetical protein
MEKSPQRKRAREFFSFISFTSFASFTSLLLQAVYLGAVEIPPAGFLITSL